jgi:membrane associated rhomboid family serine protease
MIPIPLRSSEPVHSRTPIVTLLILVNALIFFYQLSLNQFAYAGFVEHWGIIPDQFRPITLVTSQFLHGGWIHILANMIFLRAYGRNIEDLLGSSRFLVFYLLCGLAAGLVHVLVNYYSRTPTIGASGAIAGVMGAFLIKYPKAHMYTLVFILVFVTTMELPAGLMLILWLAGQFFSGIGSLAEVSYTGGGTAWFAHIGGFLVGMLLVRIIPVQQRLQSWHSE